MTHIPIISEYPGGLDALLEDVKHESDACKKQFAKTDRDPFGFAIIHWHGRRFHTLCELSVRIYHVDPRL